MIRRLLKCVCLVVFLLALNEVQVDAFYSSQSDVIQLNSKNFDEVVFSNEHLVIVEFFAPWCGHCKTFVPEYEKVASTLRGLAKVAAIDCDEATNQPICNKYDVKGFPTIKVFPKLSPGKRQSVDYKGARTASALAGLAIQRMPSFVKSVTGSTIDSFLESQKDIPKAILMTSRKETSPLWKGLSAEFHDRILLAEGKEDDRALMKYFKLDQQLPKLLIFPTKESGRGSGPIIYDGDMKYTHVSKFLETFAQTSTAKRSSSSYASQNSNETSGGSSSKPPKAYGTTVSQITNQQDLDLLCLSRESGMCGIFFVRSEPDAVLEKLMLQVSKNFMNRNIHFVWLDGLSHGYLLDKLGETSTDLPSLIIVHPHKRSYTAYRGRFTDRALLEGIDSILLGSDSGHRKRYIQFPTLVA